jgi:hypothetical protein
MGWAKFYSTEQEKETNMKIVFRDTSGKILKRLSIDRDTSIHYTPFLKINTCD